MKPIVSLLATAAVFGMFALLQTGCAGGYAVASPGYGPYPLYDNAYYGGAGFYTGAYYGGPALECRFSGANASLDVYSIFTRCSLDVHLPA